MSKTTAAVLLTALLSGISSAQQIGTTIPEVHPILLTQKCTLSTGCKTLNTSLVADSLRRPFHSINSTATRCYLGSALCSDAESCATNCALEGLDYEAMGVFAEGGTLTLNQWLKQADGRYQTVSPRVYLVSEDDKNYEDFRLLNKEITFDVDVSKLPCGMNGALYLSEMEIHGGRGDLNPAGAQYGTGYCDAQCPQLDFIDGVANIGNKYGACCNEFDIWEANARAQSHTPHPCTIERAVYKCLGETECGQPEGVCDKWGCGYNPYALGHKEYYGHDLTVNSNKTFTVVTQFITDNNQDDGTLVEIKRLYIQDGKVIKNQAVTVGGGKVVDSINNDFCKATAEWTEKRGGLAEMGKAIGRGMVLIFSLWADDYGFMNWLNSGNSGPCNDVEGDPRLIVQENPDASVTFSNIKWGELGSTFSA